MEKAEKIHGLLIVRSMLLLVVVATSPVIANTGGLSLVASHDLIMPVQFSLDSKFIEIGKELSESPVGIINSIAVKQLPAIPATLFMALVGFLCVSFVRDRKIWLTVIFGALYLGAAGVNAVPQLLAKCNEENVKQSYAKKAVRAIGDFVRPTTSGNQVTRYIGLLHRMAIPDNESFDGGQWRKSITSHRHSSNVLLSVFSRFAPFSLNSYFSVIKSFSNSKFSIDDSSEATRSWGCLLRLFTSLNSLAHGPPVCA